MEKRKGDSLRRYAVAVLVVAISTLLRHSLMTALGEGVPFILYFPAVVVSAWYGGFGPGLLTTALSAISALWFFIPPYHSLAIPNPTALIQLGVFAGVCVFISFLTEALHREREKTHEILEREQQTRSEREASQKQLASILDTISEGFYVLDGQWRYTYVNREAIELGRRPKEELLGKNIWEVYPESVGNQFYVELHRAMREQVPVHFEDFATPLGRWFANDVYPSEDGLSIFVRDITARRQMEESLRASEEHLRLTHKVVGLGTWEWNVITGQVYWSPEYREVYGLDPAEEPSFDKGMAVVREEDREGIRQALAKALAGHEEFRSEHRIRHPEKGKRWIQAVGRIIYDESQKPVRMTGFVMDVTEQKRIKAERDRFFSLSFDLMVIIEVDGTVRHLNQAWEKLLGYTLEELSATSLVGFVHPEDRAATIATQQRLFDGEELVSFENRYRCRDGSYKWLSWNAVISRQDGLCYAVGRDITERKLAEEALRDQESRLRLALESARIGTWDSNPRTGELSWDERCKVIFDLPEGGEVNMGVFLSTLHPEDREPIRDAIRRALDPAERAGYNVEYRVIGIRDGAERWVAARGQAFFNEAGEAVRFVGTVLDVTEGKRAEEARLKFAAIVESSDDAIISKTLDGIITSWNPGAERIYGYQAEEVLGRPISLLSPPEQADEEPAILERLRRGERLEHYETVRRRKDGRLINVSLTVSPIRDASGRITGASRIARDITRQKQAEEEREQLLAREQAARSQAEEASRLKDDFLATVSHELRTPLNSILGWARMLRSGKLDAQAAARAIETIERNARSQAGIIEDILDVSRIITGRLRLDFQTVDLQPVIEAAVDSVRPAAESRGVLIEQRLDAAVSHVSGDPQRIQQVIWNLLSNAIKFTPRGGRVRIALERINSHIEITVSDTGVGIRSEFLPYVFDRFRQADSSSTRMHGGLGLGLAIVRHLVELHGGAVSAESGGEGQGATFRVRLPLVAVRGETEGPGRRPPAALSKGGLGLSSDLKGVRVLVVDDEADARDLLSVVLAQSGAEVKAAASAAEALTAIEQWRPHVLVSDIGMPVEDGHALIRRLRALGPERGGLTPAVALTAYARSEDRLRALSAGYQMHVAKPVDPEELAAVIASLAGRLVRDRATE